jgi:hypothetical protein
MKIHRDETARTLSESLTVYFGPVVRASGYWRERGRTHSQAFRFEHSGREYWGEVVRTFDRNAATGERVSVDVELRTRSGLHGRALPENQRVMWRAAIRRQFSRDLAAFVESQGAEPEPVPAGPETAGTVSIESNWATAAGVIEIALMHGTGEGRRMAREELRRMAALADERNALAPLKAEADGLREALLTLAIVANETAHCIGPAGDSARDEMDSAVKGAYAALGTAGAEPSPASRIARAAQIARETRGGLTGGARDVVQSILAALDPCEADPLARVERITVADAEADGSPCYRVAAETADGSPVDAIQYAPRYPDAERAARAMAARYGVDIYDSTAEGRAALAREVRA